MLKKDKIKIYCYKQKNKNCLEVYIDNFSFQYKHICISFLFEKYFWKRKPFDLWNYDTCFFLCPSESFWTWKSLYTHICTKKDLKHIYQFCINKIGFQSFCERITYIIPNFNWGFEILFYKTNFSSFWNSSKAFDQKEKWRELKHWIGATTPNSWKGYVII